MREKSMCGRWDLDPGYQLGGLMSFWRASHKTRLDDDRTTVGPRIGLLMVHSSLGFFDLIDQPSSNNMCLQRPRVDPNKIVKRS